MAVPRLPERIPTQRLVLRRQRPGDAVVLRELWAERDPRVPPHRRIGPDGRPTVDDLARWLESEAENRRFLSVERGGSVIGYCGLLFDGRGSADEPELAYELLGREQGHGYATEAAGAVVAWADTAGIRTLWAGVRDWNLASRAVLRKLGFVETGRIEPDERYGDSLITVRDRPDHS